MPSLHVGNLLPPNQLARWNRAIGSLRAIESRDREDPYVFHGTTSLSAAHIMRDGFKPSHIRAQPIKGSRMTTPAYPMSCEGVHWGSVNIAAFAVDMHIRPDDRPVILYARLSDVMRSGVAVPDWKALEHSMGRPYEDRGPSRGGEVPHGADWRLSLERSGAFGVIDGRHVDNIRISDPLARMPVHPGWSQAREDRLASMTGDFPTRRIQPPPGHVEPTPESHPPTWSRREALVAVTSSSGVRSDEALRTPEEDVTEDVRVPRM